MKRKLFNLTLSLVYIFTMAAIVVPAGVAMADYADYTLANYDVRYVAKYAGDLNGTNEAGDDSAGHDGSINLPWRTITKAVNELPYGLPSVPDMIVVGRSFPATGGDGWYGGASPENIVIEDPVTLVSMHGSENTIINVSQQGFIPGAVIDIQSSDVIIDDFTIVSNGDKGGGAPCGVLAWPGPPADADPIENVKVLNCHIKIDEYDDACGIWMMSVKYPVIHGNDIDVGTMGGELDVSPFSVSFAHGIIMFDCFTAEIHHNELDVQGFCLAVGIEMDQCPKSLVGVYMVNDTPTPGPNDIEVLAGSDVMAFGIKVFNSPLIDIMHNLVAVKATGDYFALGYGIKVWFSDRCDVIDNQVSVEVNLPDSFVAGFLMARGISLKMCNGPNNVADNTVAVLGVGYVSESMAMSVELEEDIAEDLAEFEPILLQSLGIDQSFVSGMATGVGISVKGCPGTAVTTNIVDVTLDVDIIAGGEIMAAGEGGGCAVGISGLGSPGINVAGNSVTVWDDVFAQVIARLVHPTGFMACAGVESVSIGIILDCSAGVVTGNSVNADADINGVVIAEEKIGSSGAEESALARFDSEILGAIYLHLTETLESEEVDIDVALSGDIPSLQTIGSGDASAVGIGVMVTNSMVVAVTGNQPVSGTGDVILSVTSNEIDPHDAIAAGGGMGLGIGIAIIDTLGATVSGNTGVNGAGTADVDVGAQHQQLTKYATANGGGSGIGVGILLCGMMSYEMEAFDLPEDQHWMYRPMVTNNTVTASGTADPVKVIAKELTESNESCAYGQGLGLALGIAAVWYPCIIIDGNTVDATAHADVDVDSEAVHEYDPTSVGGATGIGIGIITVNCFHAQISHNDTDGTGTAISEVGATENWLDQSAWGFGGALGMGAGIIAAMSPASLITGNTANGWGDAYCDVIATSYIPLSDAHAFSLATGVGKGIAVCMSPCTDVIRCNTAAGEGTARVMATYDADFGNAGACGFAGSFDILMKLVHVHPKFLEEDVDAEGKPRHRFGVVNYNSIVDPPISLGRDNAGVDVMDAGLLKVGHPPLDATLNWWNHPSGPSGFGPGVVDPMDPTRPEAVYWCGFHPHPVCFTPWLYVVHTDVLEEQIGKFGFFIPMSKGLNTFSTPIALEMSVIPSRTWGDIVTNSGLAGKVKYINRWNSTTQLWETVQPGDFIDPLYAFYIYMLYPGENIILYVNSDTGHPYAMPTRVLPAEWSLIGPNPQWFPFPGMAVRPALTSILLTPANLPGYTQAISPNVFSQPAWVFVPSMPGPGPLMLAGRGYWVWMENLDTLVGFGFSPLPAGP
jgi:hypothetical protein